MLARHLCSSTPLVYLFIYMFGRMYVILYFDPPYFCARSAFDPVPNFTKQNPLVFATITRITLEIELFTALICFAGAVKTQNLMGAPFLFELVAVVVNALFVTVISSTQQHLLDNSLSTRRTTKVSLA